MNYIKSLIKTKVDKVIAGGSNGSIILFDLLKDDNKFVIYIYCAWRLSDDKEVLTGWNDESGSSETNFVLELKKLEGDIINEVSIKSFGDFTCLFKSGKKLDIFCDITSNGGENNIEENWSICDISKNSCSNFTNYFTFTNTPFNSKLK